MTEMWLLLKRPPEDNLGRLCSSEACNPLKCLPESLSVVFPEVHLSLPFQSLSASFCSPLSPGCALSLWVSLQLGWLLLSSSLTPGRSFSPCQ